MSAPLVLGTLDEQLDELPGARTLLSASGRVELAWLPDAFVRDFVIRYEPPDAVVAELALIFETAGAELAQIGPIAVRLVPATLDDRPLLIQFRLGGASAPAAALALYDLRLGVELRQPWLRRVDLATGRVLPDPFRFEADAMVRIASDGGTDFVLYGLSVPPFEIGSTGLVIALDDCQLAVDGHGVPLSLRDLAASDLATEAFDGVYARRARLVWLPQFRVPFADVPGVALNFDDVLIDATGVSFLLDEHWDVVRETDDPRRLSPSSSLFGAFFEDRLRVAFESATARVVQNVPVAFSLDGWLECAPLLPLLHARLSIERDPQTDAGTITVSVTQEPGTGIDLALGPGNVTIEQFAAEGTLDDDGLRVAGSARFAATLPGWNSGAIDVAVTLEIGSTAAALSVSIPALGLGPLGRLSDTQFALALDRDDEGDWAVTQFGLQATLEWHDIEDRLGLSNAPPQVPRPPDDARATASIQWQGDNGLSLLLEAEAGDPTTVFAFLPASFRPEVRSVSFGFQADYDDARDFFGAPAQGDIAGRLFAGLRFRPVPHGAFADSAAVTLHTGDAEGFVAAQLIATLDPQGATSLSLEVHDGVELDVCVPGVTDAPFMTAKLTRAALDLSASGSGPAAAAVSITLEGEFAVYPAELATVGALAAPLSFLLQPLMHELLTGTVSATLALRDDRAALDLACTLDRVDVAVDVFEVVARLAGGRTDTQSQRAARQHLDVDLSIAFALLGLRLQAGSLDETEAPLLAVEAHFQAALAGATLTGFARFSTDEFALGIDGATLPLQLPPFPLAPDDAVAMRDAGGTWTQASIAAAVAAWRDEAAALPHDDASRARRSELEAKAGLAQFIQGVSASLGSAAARRDYQDKVTQVIGVIAAVQGVSHSDSRPELVIDSAELRVPFADPRQIGIQGTAHLDGFAPDDPLHGLNSTALTLGLSADQIYFELTGSGDPVPLPQVAGYDGGTVSLSQLSFGYGFTRNSFAMAFAGALHLPDGLREDADTSTRIGFGIRVPQDTRLAFRLDMIPVPGPIPVVPAFEFALDLRSPGTPAVRATQVCTPAFDGLELVVPGVVHADLKQIAASPLFGIIPAFNVRFDGDIDIGNDAFGLTLIIDDAIALLGLGTPPNTFPVPFLIDPAAPYFEHLCVNARFAGFGINFDLERPLPLPSPLIAFEVLGLIADPLRPIDPNGPLARCVRIALRDAYVSIPRWARPLIPGGAELVRQEIDVEINVGTLISAVQWLVREGGAALDGARNAVQAGEAALRDLAAHPPRLDIAELLALLPPELRTVDCELSFAGFEASATLILAAGDAAPPRRPAAPPRVPTARGRAIGALPTGWHPIFIGPSITVPGTRPVAPVGPSVPGTRPVAPVVPTVPGTRPVAPVGPTVPGTRPVVPTAPSPLPAALAPFEALGDFDGDDLRALPALAAGVAAVLVAAHVRVLGTLNYRFLGRLASDGSFALVTRLDVAPLALTIAGIRIALPLACEGRLRLEGRVTPRERHAEVIASGRGAWDVIPGVVRVTAGARQPVELRLDSRGRFRLQGEGALEILGPAMRIDGSIDASESHLAVTGGMSFTWGPDARHPTLALSAQVACRVGPGPSFAIAGRGSLRLFDLQMADVEVAASERAIALRAHLARTRWRIGALGFDTHVHADFEGQLTFAPVPALHVRGDGALELLGAGIDGTLRIDANARGTSVRADGRLTWLGREWLDAAVAIDTQKGVDIVGRVSVALDLTPDKLPGGVEVARLFLRAEIGGRFTFGANGALSEHDLRVDWTLAIGLPSGAPGQAFTLAMQKLELGGNGAPNTQLMHVQGITFVPLANVTVPVPKLTWDEESVLSARINLPVLDQVPVLMTESFRSELRHDFGNAIVKDSQTLFDIPKNLSLGTKNESLGELASALSFRVRFLWTDDGDLGFRIDSAGQSRFVGLSDLL